MKCNYGINSACNERNYVLSWLILVKKLWKILFDVKTQQKSV